MSEKIEEGDWVTLPCGNDAEILVVNGSYALCRMLVLREKEHHKIEDLKLKCKKKDAWL